MDLGREGGRGSRRKEEGREEKREGQRSWTFNDDMMSTPYHLKEEKLN